MSKLVKQLYFETTRNGHGSYVELLVGIGNGNVNRKENVNWIVLCYASHNGYKTILVLLCTSKLQDCLETETFNMSTTFANG